MPDSDVSLSPKPLHKSGHAQLSKLVDIEEQLGRKISLTVYRSAEYRRKLEAKNHFLVSVMEGPKIELMGKQDE